MEQEENIIAKDVVDACLMVHRELGPGLLESVYEVVLEDELLLRGHQVARQLSVPLVWRGKKLTKAFDADLVINGKLLVELKSVEELHPVHFKQTLTYLRLLDLRLGLLVNFGDHLLKNGLHRIANKLPDSTL